MDAYLTRWLLIPALEKLRAQLAFADYAELERRVIAAQPAEPVRARDLRPLGYTDKPELIRTRIGPRLTKAQKKAMKKARHTYGNT